MDKRERLIQLQKKMEADTSLALSDVSRLVFGEGNHDAGVLFIGEAPGLREDELGRPFVGRSGTILNTWLAGIGWQREDVYITNIVKRRPPDNRDPLPDEIAGYAPYLQQQIDIIKPRIIATLGRFSMNYFLPTARISRDQGTVTWWNGHMIIPVLHPAAAMRKKIMMEQSKETFLVIKKMLEHYDEQYKGYEKTR
ncbi:MAG: uracil-DNA glycosylase [bacterium]|nr:uracil-DNA glycosylase [bacterium]